MMSCLSDILRNGSKEYPPKMEGVLGPARSRTTVGGGRAGCLAEPLWSEHCLETFEKISYKDWLLRREPDSSSLSPQAWGAARTTWGPSTESGGSLSRPGWGKRIGPGKRWAVCTLDSKMEGESWSISQKLGAWTPRVLCSFVFWEQRNQRRSPF